MVNKITYGKRSSKKRTTMFEHDDKPSVSDMNKRQKTDSTEELDSLTTSSIGTGNTSSSRTKRGIRLGKPLSRFGGPMSLPEEASEGDVVRPKKRGIDVFEGLEKALHQPSKLKNNGNIHGSFDEFTETMKQTKQTKKHDSAHTQRSSYRQLPTPPAETQSKANSHTSGSSIKVVIKSVRQTQSPSEASTSAKHDAPREPYQLKAYEAEGFPAPRADIVGNRLSSKSRAAKLWSVNQTQSPFLKLPAEVRNTIYEYALGGNTINIGYETYRITYKDLREQKAREVLSIFKYRCSVYDLKGENPFNDIQKPYIKVSHELTLLNNICRQLYLETAVLPYKLNTLCFDSYSILFNMLVMEKRLTRQHLDVIEMIKLPNELPQASVLAYLRNLKQVSICSTTSTDKGVYRVVREEGREPKLERKSNMRFPAIRDGHSQLGKYRRF